MELHRAGAGDLLSRPAVWLALRAADAVAQANKLLEALSAGVPGKILAALPELVRLLVAVEQQAGRLCDGLLTLLPAGAMCPARLIRAAWPSPAGPAPVAGRGAPGVLATALPVSRGSGNGGHAREARARIAGVRARDRGHDQPGAISRGRPRRRDRTAAGRAGGGRDGTSPRGGRRRGGRGGGVRGANDAERSSVRQSHERVG